MSWADLLGAADRIRGAASDADQGLARLPLAAIGWATVEAERAIRELDAAVSSDEPANAASTWTEVGRDATLGARVWERGPGAAQPGPALLVLEPDTEGRLAASLARFGEGVAAIYLGEGPIRPGRLVGGGKPWGPHVVVL